MTAPAQHAEAGGALAPARDLPPAIELRGVSKRYGNQVALEPLNLEIREGEFFCLLGPSGCGKTTTLNLIGGFVEASGGEILIQGQRADRVPPHKRNVNTVFQNYALFPHLTARGNIEFGLKRHDAKDIDRRVQDVLAMVDLLGKEMRRPAQLSGGERQRVALVRRRSCGCDHDPGEALAEVLR